uniref:Enoyl reductase (ER) domain-containing protein n=1 Tax=Globisporangium ultimum (strain ATCC 200006 / CBS 805.95 / DAOM BR144) TaxID=431595 RepID=K3WJC1_GLOUD
MPSPLRALIPATFRAHRYAKYGAADQVLELRSDVPQAPLSPTQVRVKVHSAAIDSIDVKLMAGYVPPFLKVFPTSEEPLGIGFDAAGTVVETGSAVKDDGALQVGDTLHLMTPFTAWGSFAEYLTVDHNFAARKPTALSFDQAAGLPLSGLTSYQALQQHAKFQKGERVLILDGSSATGIFAIQIAKAVGAHVITTASTRNVEFVKSVGADQVIDYSTTTWADVLPLHSIDVFYDCGIDANVWNTDAQNVLWKETGRLVSRHPIAEPTVASKYGAKLLGRIVVQPSGAQLSELARLVDDGKIVTPIDLVHRLENVLDAVARVASRHATGKIVIQVAPEAQ